MIVAVSICQWNLNGLGGLRLHRTYDFSRDSVAAWALGWPVCFSIVTCIHQTFWHRTLRMYYPRRTVPSSLAIHRFHRYVWVINLSKRKLTDLSQSPTVSLVSFLCLSPLRPSVSRLSPSFSYSYLLRQSSSSFFEDCILFTVLQTLFEWQLFRRTGWIRHIVRHLIFVNIEYL